MEEKINVAEILKDKPQGTKLYSPICGECKLSYIESEKLEPQISTESDAFGVFYFWDDGKAYNEGECLLFPSDKMRDWAKFAWKKGDVLKNTAYERRVIFDGFLNDDYTYFKGKHPLDCSDKFNIKYYEECNCFTGNYRLESTDAAKTYINTLEKKLGGKLNREILVVEKPHPKFKDGDIVIQGVLKGINVYIIKKCIDKIDNKYNYYARYNTQDKEIDYNDWSHISPFAKFATDSEKQQLFDALAKEGKAWDADKKEVADLKPKVELKPFDRVLVRDSKSDNWRANLFGYIGKDGYCHCVYANWAYCIPYEGNESLLGTSKDVEG